VNPLGTIPYQVAESLSEIELNIKCFAYGEDAGIDVGTTGESAAAKVVKTVSPPAARWHFDPTAIDGNLKSPAGGIAGKSSRSCQDQAAGAAFAAQRKGNRKEIHVIQH
jgi:hypothetical protein